MIARAAAGVRYGTVPPAATRLIYLVRHGETAGNAERIVQVPGMPLSPRGIAQAERVGRRLHGAGIARILSSDLARAAATAEALTAATGAPVELDPLLQERNFGDVRGTPYAELRVDLFAPDFAPPHGETWAAFRARVALAWARVVAAAAAADGHLAVVTHGLVCRVLAERHLLLPAGLAAPERWGNTAVTIAEGCAPWRVQLLNCVAHLEDSGAAPPGAAPAGAPA
jgi:probable phosphoglycerate mutase